MCRLVRLLLHLFPKGFRQGFEADILETFDDRWREHKSVSLAARTIFDLIASAWLERFATHPQIAEPARTGDSQ